MLISGSAQVVDNHLPYSFWKSGGAMPIFLRSAGAIAPPAPPSVPPLSRVSKAWGGKAELKVGISRAPHPLYEILILYLTAAHLCQQGNAPTTFPATTITLQHYIIIALCELFGGEMKAVDILGEEQEKGVDHQKGRAVEDRVPGVQLWNQPDTTRPEKEH